MEHRATRKLIQAAMLSFLVLTTTSGVTGWKMITANSVISQAGGPGGVLVPRPSIDQPDPPPTPTPVPPLPVP
jgi:hypothetical protein